MAVTRVCYATRDEVKLAPDFLAETTRGNSRIDRALRSSTELIEGELKRTFYPVDATYSFDWPNFTYTAPWRLWLDQWDILAVTAVQSPPGTAVPLASVFLRPWNRKPGWPFTFIELDRSSAAAWGAAPTPQKSIQVTGTWGFTNDTDPAGTLAAAMTDTTGTAVTVSDGSQLSPGDLFYADSERMVVADKAAASASVTLSGTGCTTQSDADVALTATGAGTLNLGEVILIDQEKMLVEDIAAGVATVKRNFDGTLLQAHTAGVTINAYRALTVLRGQLGTTAATHLNAAPLSRWRCPGLVKDLAIAEAVNRVLQETSGYARTVGEAESARPAPGVALADMWDEVSAVFGRAGHARSRAV